jgi:hypothetical protein
MADAEPDAVINIKLEFVDFSQRRVLEFWRFTEDCLLSRFEKKYNWKTTADRSTSMTITNK